MKSMLLKRALPAIAAMSISATGPYGLPATHQDSPLGNRYWQLVSATITPAIDLDLDGKPDTDLGILLLPCDRDDADQYRSDGVIITDRGTTLCEDDEQAEREETGTWTYDAATKTLTMDRYDSDNIVTAKLESASATQLVLVAKHRSNQGMHTIRTILKAVDR